MRLLYKYDMLNDSSELIMIYYILCTPAIRRRPAAGTIKNHSQIRQKQRKWISSTHRPQGFHVVPFAVRSGRLSHASNTILLPNAVHSSDLLMNRISVFMFMHVLMVAMAIDDELMRSFNQTWGLPHRPLTDANLNHSGHDSLILRSGAVYEILGHCIG